MPTDLTQHWRLAFENNYLGAWNLWDKTRNAYRTASVKIAEMRDERIVMQGGRKELKRLVFFEGKRVPMVLTKTMGKVLEQMFGPIPQGWIGKSITIYVERGVRVQGGTGDVLRIKNDRAASGMKRDLGAPPEDDVPMAEPEQFGEEEKDDERLPG